VSPRLTPVVHWAYRIINHGLVPAADVPAANPPTDRGPAASGPAG
jgi:hypothetical protein